MLLGNTSRIISRALRSANSALSSISGFPVRMSSSAKSAEELVTTESTSSEELHLHEKPTKNENPVLDQLMRDVTTTKNVIKRNNAMLEDNFTPYRYVYPEFLPDPTEKYRNRIREKIERMDMLKRRTNIDIPEFYVGSLMSVTSSDPNAPNKSNTFVGICTERQEQGLRASFTLRNFVDGQGIEIMYHMYNPTIQSIVVLRLEKRLDENLRYLRDCAPEYSTVPFDMTPEVRNPDDPVPINTIKVKLKKRPWSVQWGLWDLKGVDESTYEPQFDPSMIHRMARWRFDTGYATLKYDLMKNYRETIPIEDQVQIYQEIHPKLVDLTQTLRRQRKKRTFTRPQKTA